MKTYLTFILLLMFGFISTAQKSKFESIEDSISFKPMLTLIDFSDFSVTINNKPYIYSAFNNSQKPNKQLIGLNVDMLAIETMREGFRVFSPELLKKRFFKDFNITYRRSELIRLLPKVPDYRSFYPCTTY